MSSAVAIAGVTRVLKDLLNDHMINNDLSEQLGTDVVVSVLAPDVVESTFKDPQLNLYMYRVSLNTGWSNSAWPSRNGQGDRVTNPPLALDLHYMLTAYSKVEYQSEVLLGYGMHLLHKNPVLGRESIRISNPAGTSITGKLPPALKKLGESGLADQVEQIRITLEPLSTEELSKLWTAFQAKYKPSAAYKATVVLIQDNDSVIRPLPVAERKFTLETLRLPMIEEYQSSVALNPFVETGKVLDSYYLKLLGLNLEGTAATVDVGGRLVAVDVSSADRELYLQLPANLPAGTHSISVQVPRLIGTTTRSVRSNTGSIELSPEIRQPAFQKVGMTPGKGKLSMQVVPNIQKGQGVDIVLTPAPGSAATKKYTLPFDTTALVAPAGNANIQVAIQPGVYLVRIEVDGAVSDLKMAAGIYSGPTVNIT